MSRYNGWTNWETWNVLLWVNNDEPMYHELRHFIRGNVLTESRVQDFFYELFPDGTPDMDGVHELERVNWYEVTESLEEDAKQV